MRGSLRSSSTTAGMRAQRRDRRARPSRTGSRAPRRRRGRRRSRSRPALPERPQRQLLVAGVVLDEQDDLAHAAAPEPAAGEREVEASRPRRRALGPDAPAVAVHDALHRREADAGARELGGRVQPLEGREQLVGVGHVEAGAVVAHEEGARAVGRAPGRPRCAPPPRLPVNFHALPSRFSRSTRASCGIAARRGADPGSTTSTRAVGIRGWRAAPAIDADERR